MSQNKKLIGALIETLIIKRFIMIKNNCSKKVKLALNLFLASQLCFSIMAENAFAESSSTVSQNDYQNISQLISQLGQPPAQSQSAAATQLGQYHYTEVAHALLKTIENQFKSGWTNTFIVNAAIDSLIQMANTSHSKEINQLLKIMNQVRANDNNLSNDKTFTAIQNKLNNLAIFASSNKIKLVQLTAPQQASAPTPQKLKSSKTLSTDFEIPLKKQVLDLLVELNLDNPISPNEIKNFLSGTSDYLTDDTLEERAKNDSYEIVGREKESNEVIDTLVRSKGKNPILVGPRGAGKTSIATKIAGLIIDEAFPQSEGHINELKGSFVISATPGKISMLAKSNDDSSQGHAMELYLDSIKWIEAKLGLKIILFIDEIHTLNKGQIEAMKPYLDSKKKAVRLIGASTSVELQNAMKDNPAFLRRLQQIGVSEQNFSEVLEIVQKSKIPSVKKNYNVAIDADALEVIVKHSVSVHPDKSRVDAAVTIVEDIAIQQLRKNPKLQKIGYQISEAQAYEYIQEKLKFPINPLNAGEIKRYGQEIQKHLSDTVIGQDRMVRETTNEWTKLLMSSGQKGVRTIALLGPTGTGKSLLGRELAKNVFGTEGAFLEIDANNFKTGGLSLNTLFGAPNGVESSNRTSGQLYDYLDDAGRGKSGGIILINEGERAHPDFWERMMEIMDTGRGTGGDGKERRFSKHLIIITSNRGDKIIYPPQVENWSQAEIDAQMARYSSEELKKLFSQKTSGKDEFTLPDPILTRIDKFSLAAPVTKLLAAKIASSKLVKIVKDLSEKFKIQIQLQGNIAQMMTDSSYSAGMGTRPVEKAVDNLMNDLVIDALADMHLSKNDKIEVSIKSVNQDHSLVATSKGKSVEVQLPRIIAKDKMEDPSFLAKLKNLFSNIRRRVIGQDEAIQKLSDAVIAHEANSANAERPQAFFLVGSTGTGKTEFAKALAESLYDKAERVAIIPVGHVRFDGHLNNIFGSPKGYAGSTDVVLFEQALINNPDGGIIVFDEASNMGGEDKAIKESLFKSFYNMIDEGKWYSNTTDKEYDLRKYKFIFTGNDGEKLFQGMDSDDMRMAQWKKSKDPSKVRAILRSAGVPEAFLGRMADIILYKPLLKDEIKAIADKLVKGALKGYAEKGINFEFASGFFEKMSDAFFSSDQGARSIRNIADQRLSSLVAKTIIEMNGAKNLTGHTVRFSIDDNRSLKSYATAKTPEREVILSAELINAKKQVVSRITMDASNYAAAEIKSSPRNALATSYHEAGHAVVNDSNVTGQKLSYITIKGGKLSNGETYLGYARYDEVQNNYYSAKANESMIVQKAAQLLAGQIAQKLAGYGEDAGWSNDLEKTRGMISEYLLNWGLVKGLQALRVNKQGEPILNAKQHQILDENMDRIFAEAEALATKQLAENWNFVRALVGELIHRGTVDEARFNQLEKGYSKKRNNVLDITKQRVLPKTRMYMCKNLFGK
jgi:ATP-dependent Clp protease ATP-binding subunit ClpA